MNGSAKTWALAATLVVFGCSDRSPPSQDGPAKPPATSPPSPDDPRLRCVAELDAPPDLLPVARALCSDVVNLGVVGASIAVARDGEVVFAGGVGRRCAGAEARPDGDTPFRVGSITKMFTSALALALVCDQALDLDAPVTRYLPDLKLTGPGASAVTMRHLLSHTAGVANLMPTPELVRAGPDAWLRRLEAQPLSASPGARYDYSNGGYYVAGRALERLGKAPFATLMRDEVLEPLGLAHTTVDPRAALRLGAACGHTPGPNGPVARDVSRDFEELAHGAEWTAPAGGVIASAVDVVRFLVATDGSGALPLDRLAAEGMPTGRRPAERYGLGVAWEPLPDGTRLFRHSGNTGDFAADVYWIPKRRFAVAVLAGGGRHLRATARAVLSEVAGVTPPPAARQ